VSKSKNRNRQSGAGSSVRKNLRERLAAQAAAEAAAKRQRYTIIGIVAAVAVLAIVLVVVLVTGGKTASMSGDSQTVGTTMTIRGSSDITVKAGTPVIWTIRGASGDLGCMDGVRSQFFAFRGVSAGKTTTVSFTPPTIKGTYTVYCSHGVKVCEIKVT
jgi:plastocyanin